MLSRHRICPVVFQFFTLCFCFGLSSSFPPSFFNILFDWLLFADLKAKINSCNFIKKRLEHRCFLVKHASILRTTFFERTPPVAASNITTYLKYTFPYLLNDLSIVATLPNVLKYSR